MVPEHALPEEEEEFDEEEEPQKEEEFKDEMDIDFDDEMDDPEVIYPYEVEADVLPPPPSSDSEPEDEIVPTGRSTFQLLPPVRRFSVKSISQQMNNQAKVEFSNLKGLCDVDRYIKEFDSDLRDEIQNRIKLEWNMTTLEDQVQDFVHGEREENKKLKKVLESTRNDLARVSWDHYHLKHWSVEVRENLKYRSETPQHLPLICDKTTQFKNILFSTARSRKNNTAKTRHRKISSVQSSPANFSGHHPTAVTFRRVFRRRHFSGEFSGRVQKCFSPTDLSDPHHHAPPRAATTPPQPSSSSSPPNLHHDHHHHSPHHTTTVATPPPPRHHHIKRVRLVSGLTPHRVRWAL
ncbi:hypothetical protein Tco_1362574 [Tanacetum coccineum]